MKFIRDYPGSEKEYKIVKLKDLKKYNLKACSKMVRYEKINKKYIYVLQGLELNKGYIYKFIDVDQFSEKEIKIPKNFKKKNIKKILLKKYFCNQKTKKILPGNKKFQKIQKNLEKYKKYFIHDNYDRPFIVYIKSYNVYVYRIPKNRFYLDEDFSQNLYVDKIKKFKSAKIFVGKSPKIKMTILSGGHGPRFIGNTILLKIKKNVYVFIGLNIYEFKTDDEIIKYYSPVGNNDVPYPVAIGKKYFYFMISKTQIPVEYFNELKAGEKADAYSYYYGHKGKEPLSKYSKKMKGVKIIQNKQRLT